MPRNSQRHGCLVALTLGLALPGAAAEEPVRVRSQVFDIEYSVNGGALPLDSVRLWYTQDGGANWQVYAFDEDRQSPVIFHAPGEGLFGFFLVLTNATGASSPPPGPSTTAHQTAFVDFSPPVVQLHPLRLTSMLGQRVLQIRWTAIDSQLDARPIELNYQRPPAGPWIPVSTDPLANTGRYDWRLPDDLTGAVTLRVTVSDQGGHRTDSETQTLELLAVGSDLPPSAASSASGSALPLAADDAATVAGSKRAGERVARLFAEAQAHRDRGEYAEGIARLREVVKLNPQMTEAFAEMGGLLYRVGDLDRSLNAYQIALRQQPALREALRGAAMVDQQRKDYASAAERLRTILRNNPNDAEIWMSLGDIAVFQGDEIRARECYTRATQIDPQAARIIADARQRLALMAEPSRNPRPKSP